MKKRKKTRGGKRKERERERKREGSWKLEKDKYMRIYKIKLQGL